METIPDIIRGFRAADGEVLRIAGAEAEPFAAVDPRHLRVEAAAGASARIVVLHTAPDVSSLTLTLAEGAQLELTELFTAEAFAEVSVKQAARSRCRLTTALLSSANASYRIDLDGADAENELGGVFLAAGNEHCVVKLRTGHNVADCRSNSYIKGVAGGQAVGEFCGLVYVAPDAQRTDARQQSRNILLSGADGCRGDTLHAPARFERSPGPAVADRRIRRRRGDPLRHRAVVRGDPGTGRGENRNPVRNVRR